MTWLFIILAALAFMGFGVNARNQNGYAMAWSAALFLVWVFAALWWSGRL